MRDVRVRRRQAAAAVLGLVAVLGTACSNNGSSGSSSSSSGAADTAVLGDKNAATGSPVKIGLFNVEGGSAVSEPEEGDAAVAAADYANDYLGGIGGHKIEIVRCADKADGASAAACGNQFVQAGVPAIVVGQPATADQIVPVVQGAGIPWVGGSPSAPTEFADPNAYFFSSGFLGLLAGEAVYAKQQGWKTVTVIGSENPQLVATLNALGKSLFQGQGVTLNLVTVPQGTADATAQVTEALQPGPDAISIFADPTVCQAVLSAMVTVGAQQPKMANSSCIAQPVVDAVGAAGIDKLVLFNSGDVTGDDTEAQLYRAVMQQYAPDTDPGGMASGGYLSMLGFVRAVNAGGLASGDVTSAAVAAALKGAKDVPLPIGDGTTFSCDATQFPSPAIKSTVCTSKVFVTTYSGTKPGPYQTVDAAEALGG